MEKSTLERGQPESCSVIQAGVCWQALIGVLKFARVEALRVTHLCLLRCTLRNLSPLERRFFRGPTSLFV